MNDESTNYLVEAARGRGPAHTTGKNSSKRHDDNLLTLVTHHLRMDQFLRDVVLRVKTPADLTKINKRYLLQGITTPLCS